MEINFCQYLINIGLINKESFSNLILDYHKNYSNQNFVENLKDLLSNFFEKLSKEEKKYMSINLVNNYLQSLYEKKLDKLKTLFIIFREKLLLKKLKVFWRWKIFSSMDKKEETKMIQSYEKINNSIQRINSKIKRKRNTPTVLDNYISMKMKRNRERKKNLINKSSKKKLRNISSLQNESTLKKYDSTKESLNPYKKNHKNINEIPSSITLKELKELKECTFSPKTNDYLKIGRNNDKTDTNQKESNNKNLFEIFNKLHNDNLLYKNKIKYKQEKYEKKFKEENTFRPKINDNNSFSKKLNKGNLSFDERQKLYLKKKEKNALKIKQELDDNFSKLCSFIPEVNEINNTLSKSKIIKNESNTELKNSEIIMDYYSSRAGPGTTKSKQKSPFLRLYEESKNRNLRRKSREKEYKNYINEMANISCKKETNIVNYDKLNELYLYDKKKDIIKKTKQKVEDEEGTTFKPDIYFNKTVKNITSDFYERNEKFIKDKQNFIECSIKERDKLFNNNSKENKNIDNFSKEERNEIIKNIVTRLTSECG